MPSRSLNVLIVVPTLQVGAADTGAVELVRILAAGGHKPIVASSGGRLTEATEAAGGENVLLDMDSQNPVARGARVIAVSEQIALLVNDRYGTSWDRIVVVPASVDTGKFDPAHVSRERIDAMRIRWGVGRGDRLILVTGRMLRRKGHHIAVRAISRLKAMGVKDFVCVFTAEDQGTRYAAELWDQVMASETADVVRISGPIDDLPAAYAAASVVVSAAVQPEGLQRALLEAQAMARPVIVSELGAADVVLAPPAVPHDRMTGLRFANGDDSALAAALIQLFSLPKSAQQAIGARGRAWVLEHFNATAVSEATLKLYADVAAQTTAV